MKPSQKLHLIVLTGFEVERVSELIRRCEPPVISLGYADSPEPNAKLHSEANRKSLAEVKAVRGPVTEFPFDCYDPKKTMDAILARATATPDHNIVLAPLSTKLSTVGAALAAPRLFPAVSARACPAQPSMLATPRRPRYQRAALQAHRSPLPSSVHRMSSRRHNST